MQTGAGTHRWEEGCDRNTPMRSAERKGVGLKENERVYTAMVYTAIIFLVWAFWRSGSYPRGWRHSLEKPHHDPIQLL